MADIARNEVYALRYATSTCRRASKFHRYTEHGALDGPIGMDFYFWLVRNEDRITLIDCGFDGRQTEFPAYRHSTHPIELLVRLGVEPEEVDHVVLTHMHFDHIGNIGLFPNATFSVARAEYEFWTGPFATKPFIGIGALPHEIGAVMRLLRQERLVLIDEEEVVAPGVRTRPYRGHTPGQLVTEVDTPTGQVVLASDALHFYEEMERDRPFSQFVDLEGMYRTYSALREMAARPDTTVVAGHDPLVLSRHPLVTDECVDLTRVVPPPVTSLAAPGRARRRLSRVR